MRIQQLLGVDRDRGEGGVTRSPGLQPGSRGHGGALEKHGRRPRLEEAFMQRSKC